MFNSGQSLCPERPYNLPWFGKLEIGLVIFFSSLLPLFLFLGSMVDSVMLTDQYTLKIMP